MKFSELIRFVILIPFVMLAAVITTVIWISAVLLSILFSFIRIPKWKKQKIKFTEYREIKI